MGDNMNTIFLLIVISFFTQVITHLNVCKLDVILKAMYLNNITLIHYDIVSKDVTIITPQLLNIDLSCSWFWENGNWFVKVSTIVHYMFQCKFHVKPF
jgi:hypothetical protein